MNKECQNCKVEFEIMDEDLKFYERIKVPPPTFCPKCRFARRLAWRNERSLYKRLCDACKKQIISMHKPEAQFPVYCHDCWWGDKWDPLKFGREYDFSKPFFEQFIALQRVVPRLALYETENVNSEYCNHTAHAKNCYLVFGTWFSEDCGYGQTILESKNCWDCLFIKNCEMCFGSFDCERCYQTHFSQNCIGCSDSAFLYDCRNCQNCIFSFNLRNKNYHAFNKQISKDEFEKLKREILSSYTALQKEFAKFREVIRDKALHKFYTGARNTNVSGDFIYNSKNVLSSYYINDGENEKYAVRGGKGQKDAMDVFGVHAGELVYEANNIDFSSRTFFSVNGENNMDASYLVDSFNVQHSIGSISLRQKKYCVLNKQYSEKEYNEIKQQIIDQMIVEPYVDHKGRRYAYGDFFPIEISPFAYNESLAQEYLPITKRRAAELAYLWYDVEDKTYAVSRSWKELPDTIGEVNDSILSENIFCQAWDVDKNSAQEHRCTKAFRITPNELTMYRKFNIPLPRKCPNTRNFEIFNLRNPVEFYHRRCMCDYKTYQNTIKHLHHPEGKCSNEFETSYAPERKEIVYCEQCYNAEVV